MAVPQKAKNQYLTPKEAADRITNYQVDGAVAADMSVKKPKAVENDMAKRLGYAGGSVGDPSPTADGSGKATVRVGKSDVSGVDHSNVGDPNGNFGWESYDGGEDHISHPDMYIPVYLY